MVISEKRENVLRAALELVAEHGFHGAPISSIANQAGVGMGTIYRYFANKDILITELFQELHDKIHASLLKGYLPHQPLRERFLHVSSALLRYFIANPLEFRFLEQYLNSPYGIAFRRAKLLETEDDDLFRRIFDDGVAQRLVKDLPLIVLFALSFGPILGVARDHILGFIDLDDSLIMQTIHACWDGIKKQQHCGDPIFISTIA